MTTFLPELLNAYITFTTSHAIRLYPMWKTQGIKGRAILIYLVCLTLLQSIFLLLAKFVWGVDMPELNDYIMLAGLPQIIVPFFIFRGRLWQNIFFMSVAATYGLTPGGISIYAADYWFSSLANPMIAVVALKIGLTVATLPLLLYLLKRLAENTRIDKAILFWRLFWLIPMLFLIITMLSNSVLTSDAQNIFFVVTRLLALAALMLVCYLLDTALRQASAMEAATLAAEEHAARAGFYQKMAHELLTPLTKVSTNVQVAKRHPEEAGTLLVKAHDEIMEIAEIINKALDETERSGGWA